MILLVMNIAKAKWPDKVSNDYLQGYLNEYHFRFNRRSSEEVLLNTLIKSMVENDAIRMNQIKYWDT